MDEPINPARSEEERALWHTLDEAGWSVEQIRESFAAYRNEVLREAAEKIRRHWYPRIPGNPLFTQGMDAGMDKAADLIDPDKQ